MKAIELLNWLQENLGEEELNSYDVCGECDGIIRDVIGICTSNPKGIIYLQHL